LKVDGGKLSNGFFDFFSSSSASTSFFFGASFFGASFLASFFGASFLAPVEKAGKAYAAKTGAPYTFLKLSVLAILVKHLVTFGNPFLYFSSI